MPEVLDCVKFVRLDFLEGLAHPVPRCQDLPAAAFGELGPRSLLVSISHGWFFRPSPLVRKTCEPRTPRSPLSTHATPTHHAAEYHPDPEGTKQALLRGHIRALRERFGEERSADVLFFCPSDL